MFKAHAILAIAVTALGSSTANAFEFSGATVSLEYRDNQDDNDTQFDFNATAALSFGSGFGLQFGIKNTNYNEINSGAAGAELHGTYSFADDFVVGVFVGTESFPPNDNTYVGIEGLFPAGPLSVEAAVMNYSGFGPGYDATHLAIDATYRIHDRWDVLAGYHMSDFNSGFDYTYLGASYAALDGLAVTANYGVLDFSGNSEAVVSVGISYSVGQGVTFWQRSYTELFPGD